jgi:DNA-binding LytR/AlgR family response regulator
MNLKCLVIEDELPAQRVLKKYIGDVPSLELVGMHKSAVEVMETLRDEQIDLLFLDINLPKISGLNFLRSLNEPPQVIITTAYPDYAHEGFELNVVDFLLKPFSFERFLKAVSKVTSTAKSESTLRKQQYVFVKVDNSLQKVDFETIIFIESDRDYVRVVMESGRFRHLQTLKYWDSLLPDKHFSRVHKSFIVNIAKVQKIVGNRIEMPGEIIPIGRHYKEGFMKQIELIS